MTLVVCLEENLGYLFNARRLSQDQHLLERLRERVGNAPLFATPYSAPLLSDFPTLSLLKDSVPETGSFYFLEDGPVFREKADHVLIYRWGRRYPADRYFPLSSFSLRLLEKNEFATPTHPDLCEEYYEVTV